MCTIATSLISKNQFTLIKPLWEQLNEMHYNDSRFFKEHFRNFTFEQRIEKYSHLDAENIRIEIVKQEDIPAGYCISSIEGGTGEIDSIFIDETLRKLGYGTILVNNSIKWLKVKACTKILVSVAEGHESVFEFYQKFGFSPRLTYLQLNDSGN
jgi:GNAT superfamily N-acetyltransferase